MRGSRTDARAILTDNHWHRCLHCLYRGRSQHIYPTPVNAMTPRGNPADPQEFTLWKKIYDLQNGKLTTKKKACCDDCAHDKPCAGDKLSSKCGSSLLSTQRSCSAGRRGSSDFMKNPRPKNLEDSVLWVKLGRSNSAERRTRVSTLERSTGAANTARFGATSRGSCCNLRFTEPPRNEKSLNETIFPGHNNPILDRFTAKSILKHQEVLNVPKPKMSYRLEDYRCGDGPSNLCTKNHYVKSYFLKWDMNPTSNTAKQSGKALLETIRGDNWARNYSRELQSKRDSTILNSTPLKRDTFGSTGIWSSAQVRESTYQNVDRYQRVTSSNQKGSEIFWSRSKLF